MWCIPEIDNQFIERMEDIMDLYEKPYDPQEPVIGFDEKAKQLIEDKRPRIPMKPHKPQRYDYEYRRNGTRNIFLAVEPKGGFRTTFVTKRRTKAEFAREIERIVMLPRYQTARRTHIVLDNLNTHCEKSLIETLGEEKTRAIMSRIQFHYTPKHASWLNMAEVEISILSRQCLHRRIPTETILKHDTACWEQRRNSQQATIHWRFTKEDARKIFKYDDGQN